MESRRLGSAPGSLKSDFRLLLPSGSKRALCYAPTVLERVLGLVPDAHWPQPRRCVRSLCSDWRSAPSVTPRPARAGVVGPPRSPFSRRWVGAAVLASHVRPEIPVLCMVPVSLLGSSLKGHTLARRHR